MREAFRPFVAFAQGLVRLFAAGPGHGDLLKLLFELLGGQFAALEAVTCVNNFLDVELEDIASTEFTLGLLSSMEKGPQPTTAFPQGQRDLFADLIIIGDGFLGFTGEGHPDRGHVDENHHGASRQGAFGLRYAVGAPGGLQHRFIDRAGRLLMQERHAVGIADDAGELTVVVLLLPFRQRDLLLFLALRCLLGPPAVGEARLDHEGIAAVHRRRPADRRIEISFDLPIQAGEDRLFPDR